MNNINNKIIKVNDMENKEDEEYKMCKSDNISVKLIGNIFRLKTEKKNKKINNDYYIWYKHYNNQLKHLYKYLFLICEDKEIYIKNNKESYVNFLYMMYMNSSKKKYPKMLYDIDVL
tara:strand:+ start:333 stop:683 length:351 start_codon:yes stop_codon:yes gene_type:complete